MEKTYKMLTAGVIVCKVLAWIFSVFCIIAGIVVFIIGGKPATPEMPAVPRAFGLLWILMGVLYFFFLSVASEAISLLLEIRHATKKASV